MFIARVNHVEGSGRTCNLHKHSTATMVSKMTAARIPPAMTTVPADIRNALHQQPAGGGGGVTVGTAGQSGRREGRRERRGPGFVFVFSGSWNVLAKVVTRREPTCAHVLAATPPPPRSLHSPHLLCSESASKSSTFTAAKTHHFSLTRANNRSKDERPFYEKHSNIFNQPGNQYLLRR